MNLSDVFVSFEGSAQSYITFTPAAYTNNYASSKFWHIVYGCDTDATINSTLQQFDQQHAEWLYMTDLLEPNPYDNLAGNATWTAELNYMAKHTSVGYASLTSLTQAQSTAAWLTTTFLSPIANSKRCKADHTIAVPAVAAAQTFASMARVSMLWYALHHDHTASFTV